MKIEIDPSHDAASLPLLASAIQVATPLLPAMPVGEVLTVGAKQPVFRSEQAPQFEFERTYYGARVCDASKGFITRAFTCEARIDIR